MAEGRAPRGRVPAAGSAGPPQRRPARPDRSHRRRVSVGSNLYRPPLAVPAFNVTMLRFRPLVLALCHCLWLMGVLAARPASAVPVLEPPITTTGTEGDYLRAIHRIIHFRWQ